MTGLGQSIMMKAMQQGLEQGLTQGENLLATLVNYLKRDGRLNELDRISDEEERKQLYREYHLID